MRAFRNFIIEPQRPPRVSRFVDAGGLPAFFTDPISMPLGSVDVPALSITGAARLRYGFDEFGNFTSVTDFTGLFTFYDEYWHSEKPLTDAFEFERYEFRSDLVFSSGSDIVVDSFGGELSIWHHPTTFQNAVNFSLKKPFGAGRAVSMLSIRSFATKELLSRSYVEYVFL